MELPSYGISETTIVSTWIDKASEEITRDGYTVVRDVLEADDLIKYCRLLDGCYEKQVSELAKTNDLTTIKDSHVVRLPLAYDEQFLQAAMLQPIVDLATSLLGKAFVLLMQNGIINPPTENHEQAKWHRDLNYQHWTSSKPLAINALICLDQFTALNGATFVLPGSHLFPPFPSEDYVLKNEKQIEASAGSIILMNAMTFHRAGENRSDKPRRALNHVIGVPILGQQIDIPVAVNGKWANDKFLSGYLGYRWNPKASVSAWRQSKFSGKTE